jgi:prolycopene isomerase
MATTSASGRSSFDAIVVGGGLGGLSAAAFLGRAGQRVLLVERREEFGGYAASFTRGGYRFDPAIHAIAQGEGLLLSKILRYLHVADQVELIPAGSIYEAHFPGLSVRVPVGTEQFIEAHAREFPRDADALRRLIDVMATVHREVHQLPPHLTLKELEVAVQRFPTLFKYRTATLAEVLDEFLTEDRLKAVIAAYWPYFGLPPSKLSFFTTATPMTSFITSGPFQCRGGTQTLVDALVAAVRLADGELIAGNGAERIVVEGGRVTGVELVDGTLYEAPIVVSNADAKQTFEQLVGIEHFPTTYARRFARLKESLSAVVVFAATRIDLPALGVAHTNFVHGDWSHDALYERVLAGRPGGHWLALPSLHDGSIAPLGEQQLICTSLAPYDAVSDEHDREAYVDELLACYECVIPGLRENLTFLESASPRTIERFSSNYRGAIYGWENTPSQAGSRRLARRTPVEGLFLSGHWTQPGTSSFRSIFSGAETMMSVLGAGYADEFFRALAA